MVIYKSSCLGDSVRIRPVSKQPSISFTADSQKSWANTGAISPRSKARHGGTLWMEGLDLYPVLFRVSLDIPPEDTVSVTVRGNMSDPLLSCSFHLSSEELGWGLGTNHCGHWAETVPCPSEGKLIFAIRRLVLTQPSVFLLVSAFSFLCVCCLICAKTRNEIDDYVWGWIGKKRLFWRTAFPVLGTQSSTTGKLQSPGWNLWIWIFLAQ